MSLILGADGSSLGKPLGFDPNGRVTQLEFRTIVQQMEDTMNEFGRTIHLLSMRLESLTKMATWCPEKLWKLASPSAPPRLDIGAYYAYVDRMIQQYVPVCDGILESPAWSERISMAKSWNEKNPDMPITVDELQLANIVLRRGGRFPTPEEMEEMRTLPATELFESHWKSVLDARAKMDRGEAE